MDSLEDSSPKGNRTKLKCDGDGSANYMSTLRSLQDLLDTDENMFVSMSNLASSSSAPPNGPRAAHVASLPNNEAGQKSSKLNENILESYDGVRGASQSHMSNRASSSRLDDQQIACNSKVDSNTVIESNHDVQVCQRHKVCMDISVSSYNLNTPSTSGTSRVCDSVPDNGIRENRKRPSSLKLNRSNLEVEAEDSSDTANDDYSLGSEDGCIYTYRGGEHLADLPSSFFSLDMGLPLDKHLPMPPNYPHPPQGAPNVREGGSRASSPDMDFLEMDFDPEPSCEVDTGDESTSEDDSEANDMLVENKPVLRIIPPNKNPPLPENPPAIPHIDDQHHNHHNMPSTSKGVITAQAQDDAVDTSTKCHSYGPYITHVNARGEQLLVRRTMSHWFSDTPVGLHVASGNLMPSKELICDDELFEGAHDYYMKHIEKLKQNDNRPIDSVNPTSVINHLSMAKRLILEENVTTVDKTFTFGCDAAKTVDDSAIATTSKQEPVAAEVPQCMVWSEQQACERQVTQIGTSACGATAVINVFLALNIPVNIQRINAAVGTRQRANNAPLPRYLMSRAVAGCTAADLVNGLQIASDGLVTARFFPMCPERAISLSHWLADWITIGVVPILTLNLQVACEGEIPDAWHHQMVFGVSPRGVFLCNPLECVQESVLWPRLTSPSVLLVKSTDVISRFKPNTDLTPLMVVPDRRFHTFNVLGQVVNVIRESRSSEHSKTSHTQFVRIPASYQAGVTLAALTGSDAHQRLQLAQYPPLLTEANTT